MKYKIGSRGSRLALAQSEWVKRRLQEAYPFDRFEIVVIKTKGDRIQQLSLDKLGDKGVFVKEIEEQLQRKQIDLAVHSMKDMPSVLPEGLCLAKPWEGESAFDVLLLREAPSLDALRQGAIIATGSKRRSYQLKRLRSDIRCVGIRGNIDTRIRKMEEEKLDGIILAAAGLHRLGIDRYPMHVFSPQEMVPACAQGILAIECRREDNTLLEKLDALQDEHALLRCELERGYLAAMEGSCHIPIGAYCAVEGERMTLYGVYGNTDGTLLLTHQRQGLLSERKSILEGFVSEMKEKAGSL